MEIPIKARLPLETTMRVNTDAAYDGTKPLTESMLTYHQLGSKTNLIETTKYIHNDSQI